MEYKDIYKLQIYTFCSHRKYNLLYSIYVYFIPHLVSIYLFSGWSIIEIASNFSSYPSIINSRLETRGLGLLMSIDGPQAKR